MINKGLLWGLVLLTIVSIGRAQSTPTPTPALTTETFNPMGRTHEEIANHFGYPVYGRVVSTELDVMVFHVKGGTVHIMFINNCAQQVDFHKLGFLDIPFAPDEIENLAKIIGGNSSKWFKAKTIANTWIIEDGSIGMYYGKDPDSTFKHTLSFISRTALEYFNKLKDGDKPLPAPKATAPLIKI